MSDLEIEVIPNADSEAEDDHDVEDVVTTHMTAKERTDVVEEAWNEITRSEQAALKEKIVTRRDQPVAMQEFLQVVAKHEALGRRQLCAGNEKAPLVPDSDYDKYDHPSEEPAWAIVECEIGDLVVDRSTIHQQGELLQGAEREAALRRCKCQECVREKDRRRRAAMMMAARRDCGLARDISEDTSIQHGFDGDEGETPKKRLQIKPAQKRKSDEAPAKERAKKPRVDDGRTLGKDFESFEM